VSYKYMKIKHDIIRENTIFASLHCARAAVGVWSK
jgi:hypothetical protein